MYPLKKIDPADAENLQGASPPAPPESRTQRPEARDQKTGLSFAALRKSGHNENR